MSPSTTCGSALLPRQFGAVDLTPADRVSGVITDFLTSECTDGIARDGLRPWVWLCPPGPRCHRSVAARHEARRLGARDRDAHHRSGNRPGRGTGARASFAPRTSASIRAGPGGRGLGAHGRGRTAIPHQVTQARRYDAETAAWVAKYGPLLLHLTGDVLPLADSVAAHDFAAAEETCRTGLADVAGLDGAAEEFPPVVPGFASDMTSFVETRERRSRRSKRRR